MLYWTDYKMQNESNVIKFSCLVNRLNSCIAISSPVAYLPGTVSVCMQGRHEICRLSVSPTYPRFQHLGRTTWLKDVNKSTVNVNARNLPRITKSTCIDRLTYLGFAELSVVSRKSYRNFVSWYLKYRVIKGTTQNLHGLTAALIIRNKTEMVHIN